MNDILYKFIKRENFILSCSQKRQLKKIEEIYYINIQKIKNNKAKK